MASALVWGAGGHGRVVADLARLQGLSVEGYVDADPERLGSVVDALHACVLGGDDFLQDWLAAEHGRLLILGVGANRLRLSMSQRILDDRIPALIHPTAAVAAGVTLGPGTVVMAGAVINPGATTGRGAIINSAAVVEHDVAVGDGAHISPGAVLAGGVQVHPRAWVGANATILPGIQIGADAIVGAGSVVLADVPEGTTFVGNPARLIPRERA